jgi:hypothetical protein
MSAVRYDGPAQAPTEEEVSRMTTTERPGKRLIRRTCAIVAAAAALTLLLADVGAAKWKQGTYTGKSKQAQHNAVQLDIKKKQVTVVFFDFYKPGCTYPCMQPSWAGLSGKIKKKGKKGKFEVPSPGNGYYGYVAGTVKGKKAHGSVYYAPDGYDPELPPLPISWEAKRTGPSFFSR